MPASKERWWSSASRRFPRRWWVASTAWPARWSARWWYRPQKCCSFITSTRCSPTWCLSWCCSPCWRCGHGACSARARSSIAYERLLPRPVQRGLRAARYPRAEGVVCGFFHSPSLLPFFRECALARPREPGAACFNRRRGADAAHRLCGPDLARPRGTPRRRRVHYRDPVQGIRRVHVAPPARLRRGRRRARPDFRPAEPAPARPVPRRLHAGAAFHRHLRRRRIREPARLFHRHRHRIAAHRCPPLVFCPAGGGGRDAAVRPQPAALEDRARLARDPRPRSGGRSARHQRAPRQALGVRHLLDAHRSVGLPVRLLPRLRLGGGFFALYHDPVHRDGHHRRHGLAAGRDPRHRVRGAISVRHRRRDGAARHRRPPRLGDLRRELLRLRAGDDPVPGVRAAGAGRLVAPHAKLVSPMAVQAAALVQMILLKLEKLEVAYQRVITAVQGVSLEVPKGSIVALLGTNGAGKTTTLRAISGFIGLDDARVTEGAILYRGERIENRPPHRVTALGIVLVPERSKVFENLTVEENLDAAGPRRGANVNKDLVYQYFPVLLALRRREAGYLSGGERQMLAIGSALMCAPELLLVDELSLGLAPLLVAELSRSLRAVRDRLGTTLLLVEQNAQAALDIADYGYVMENGRIVLDGTPERLRAHQDVREFYLGGGDQRRSYREVKQYRRSRRWYG